MLQVSPDQVVSQIHEKGLILEKIARCLDGVGQTQGLILGNEGQIETPRVRRYGFSDGRTGFRGDNNTDLSDPQVRNLVHHIMENGLIGHRDELLGYSVR